MAFILFSFVYNAIVFSCSHFLDPKQFPSIFAPQVCWIMPEALIRLKRLQHALHGLQRKCGRQSGRSVGCRGCGVRQRRQVVWLERVVDALERRVKIVQHSGCARVNGKIGQSCGRVDWWGGKRQRNGLNIARAKYTAETLKVALLYEYTGVSTTVPLAFMAH